MQSYFEEMEEDPDYEEKANFPKIIQLNVGGRYYTTSLLTLIKSPDNMLSAMFSGNFNVDKDAQGRYFIDADGENFIHILNYLRYGHIPPPEIAETVYREAAYFGIYSLMTELEKYPIILNKIQRSNFRSNFPGYHDCIHAILKLAGVCSLKTTTDVKLLIFRSENNFEDEEFNINHICVPETSEDSKTFSSDVELGPWKNDDTEKDLVKCIQFDMESKGFTVTSGYHSQCTYKVNESRCRKSFYCITFHWWKS